MYQNRFLLIFSLFSVLAVVLHLRLGIGSAWYLYAGAALLLAAYFLFGDVWSAFNALKRGNPGKARKILSGIYFPKLLLPRHRAYYHFTHGMLLLQEKKLDSAEAHLLEAEKQELGRPTDEALLLLNLAHINYVKKRHDRSRRYLAAAGQHPTDDLMIKDHIKQLERALGEEKND